MALSQAQLFEDECPLIRSCSALNEIRIAEEFTDLVIEVEDGARLHAHKIILAARMPCLRASLSCPTGKDTPVLKWPSVPLSLATSLVRYLYTGQVEMTQSNVRGMISFARMIKLPLLENWGTKFLIKTVNTENMESTWEFARSLNIAKLINVCVERMKAQFESFVQSDLFVRLPADTVLSLLQSDDLPVSSEEQIFAAISRWASPCGKMEDEKLRLHVPAMLKEIQWQETTAQFREELLNSHGIFQKSAECLRLMARIINWIGTADRDALPCPFNEHHRLRQAIVLFGEEEDEGGWSVLRCDSQMQNEERIADMDKRPNASYSVVGESIFVVGGLTEQCESSTRVDDFLVRERRWRKRAPLAAPRHAHAAAVLRFDAAADQEDEEQMLIGVFGGCVLEGDTRKCLASCELYDIRQNRWHKLPRLRKKRSRPAAASLPEDERVFVFGGHDGSSGLDSVEFCHLRADWRVKVNAASNSSRQFWLPAAPMRTARYGLAAVPFRGRILVAGGWNIMEVLINMVEMFAPPDARCPLGQWTELVGMKQPRFGFSLLTSDGAVFAVGDSYESKNMVEAFTAPEGSEDVDGDLRSWTWSAKSPVETLRQIFGAVSIRM